MKRQRVCQRARRDAGSRMNDQACRFIDDDQGFVFIDNFDRNVFGKKMSRRQWRKFNFNLIVCAELIGRLDGATVDQNISVFDQAL